MSQPTRFVILGTQRTGTTLIRTTLSSHPEILCLGEVFKLGSKPYIEVGGYWEYSRRSVGNRVRSLLVPRHSATNYLGQLFGTETYPAIGFKLMLSHCTARPYIWPLLVRQEVRGLWVRRRNILKTLLSRKAAALSGVYHVSSSMTTASAVTKWVPKGIYIEVDSLLHDLTAIESEDLGWQRRLGDLVSVIEIVYEDYVNDIVSWNNRIADFVGVSPCELRSDLQKVNPTELDRLILNYDDVRRVLEPTRFRDLLHS